VNKINDGLFSFRVSSLHAVFFQRNDRAKWHCISVVTGRNGYIVVAMKKVFENEKIFIIDV